MEEAYYYQYTQENKQKLIIVGLRERGCTIKVMIT